MALVIWRPMISRFSICRTAFVSRSASVSFIAARYSSRNGSTPSTQPRLRLSTHQRFCQVFIGHLPCA
ncbi:MAG: hypothetical protein DME21_00090 [Verrucomicrobia bacterium]|nr:MAG: hypothetical protein DME21_00090 [Verrucomicrobiota bacterium]